MTRGPAPVALVIPELGRPTGGCAYDLAVAEHWPRDLPPPVRHHLDPRSPDIVAALGQALSPAELPGQRAVVDGLLGCEHPEVIEAAVADGRHVVLLVHLPRPADDGLDASARIRLAALERRAVRAASAVVVPSRWAADDLQHRYGRGDLTVARPGTDTAPVAPLTDGPPVIVCLGAIGPVKNQLLLARSVLACRDLDLRLRIVGPVVDDSYAAQLATTLAPLGERASIEPAVAGPEREALLAGTDLMVSVAVTETYGLTVGEALARGIPALVGRGTGAEEALSAGGSLPGQAVATDDPGELAAAVRSFVTRASVRAHWRAEALAARARLPRWEGTARVIADAVHRA